MSSFSFTLMLCHLLHRTQYTHNSRFACSLQTKQKLEETRKKKLDFLSLLCESINKTGFVWFSSSQMRDKRSNKTCTGFRCNRFVSNFCCWFNFIESIKQIELNFFRRQIDCRTCRRRKFSREAN